MQAPTATAPRTTSPDLQNSAAGTSRAMSPPPEEVEQADFKPTAGFVLAFVSICIITLAAALDATSLSIALPIVATRLNGSAIEAFWSGTSFLLTSAIFQPVVAGLSHVFGRKQVIF